MNAQGIGTGLALAVMGTPCPQGGQQLAAAVLDAYALQRFQQFIQCVIIAVAPQQCRQPVALQAE